MLSPRPLSEQAKIAYRLCQILSSACNILFRKTGPTHERPDYTPHPPLQLRQIIAIHKSLDLSASFFILPHKSIHLRHETPVALYLVQAHPLSNELLQFRVHDNVSRLQGGRAGASTPTLNRGGSEPKPAASGTSFPCQELCGVFRRSWRELAEAMTATHFWCSHDGAHISMRRKFGAS